MIKLTNVQKKYSGNYVLDNVTLDFSESGIYILQGINGSGKSTIIKLLTGIVYKTSGELKIDNTISYLPDKFILPKLMKVKNYLSLVLERKSKVDQLISKYQIPNKRIGELSKGNLQKLGLLQIFEYEADCYILDEPIDGLDEFAKKLVKDIIKEKLLMKKIIIMSLHNKTYFNDLNPKIYDVKEGRLNEKRKKLQANQSN
jgi:ABC-2 type transport system ATP-binding protein